MLWQAGEILHKHYRLLRQLDAMSNRQTWIAEESTTQQSCVLKALYFGSDELWQDYKLLERESLTLKSVTHPNIPKFIENFWLEVPRGGYFCLVSEYISGESLADLIANNGSLTLSRVKEIAAEILTILDTLHSYAPPIIHRDIKPANLILRSTDQQVCLIDFGSVQTDTAAGRTLTIVGTYGYMAPEQFRGQTTPASDLYSLGATLLHLLSGLDPADLPRKDSQIIVDEELVGDRTFRKWLEQMLEADYKKRFSTASEAKQALLKGAEKTELKLVDKKNSQLKIAFDTLQVNVPPNASRTYYWVEVICSAILFAFILWFSIENLSHLDQYTGSLPIPFYVLAQISAFLMFTAPSAFNFRSEHLIFEKDKRQYTIYWGFLLRKSYQLKGSFKIAVDHLDPASSRRITIGDKLIALIDDKGRKFPLGKFNEEDAERLVEELKKWQEK